MPEPGANLLALAYRCRYSVVGGYVTAWWAPRNPEKHALILGCIGFVLATLGAIGAIKMDMGRRGIQSRS